MSDEVKTAAEWVKRPSYHGSYGDYVRHMRAMEEWRKREAEDRIANKITSKLAQKLKAEG